MNTGLSAYLRQITFDFAQPSPMRNPLSNPKPTMSGMNGISTGRFLAAALPRPIGWYVSRLTACTPIMALPGEQPANESLTSSNEIKDPYDVKVSTTSELGGNGGHARDLRDLNQETVDEESELPAIGKPVAAFLAHLVAVEQFLVVHPLGSATQWATFAGTHDLAPGFWDERVRSNPLNVGCASAQSSDLRVATKTGQKTRAASPSFSGSFSRLLI